MAIILTPIILFLLAAILIYLPPVQNFVVRKVTQHLSETTGMNISVGQVRLVFPLNLGVHRVTAVEGNDTIAALRSLRLDVRLIPLFSSRLDVDGFALYDMQLNTKSLIADTYLRGRVGMLEARSHGIAWADGKIHINNAVLRKAELYVALSDTAAKDTTASAPWDITVDRVRIEQTAIRLSMPGDTMRVAADLESAKLFGGHFDTGRGDYAVRQLDIRRGNVTYAARSGREVADTPHKGNPAFQKDNDILWKDFNTTAEGFDPNHIVLSGLNLRLDTLSYTADGTLRAGIANVSLHERSGIDVRELSGGLYMDSVRLSLPAFRLRTQHSRADIALELDRKALQEGRDGRLAAYIDAAIAPEDVRTLGRGMIDAEYLKAWPQKTLAIRAEASGNMDRLTLDRLEVSLPGALRLTGSAKAENALRDNRKITARFDLRTQDMTFVKAFVPADARNSFNIPRGMTARGTATVHGNTYKTDLQVAARGGRLQAKAEADLRRESYRLAANSTAFPLGDFLPGSGLGAFSGKLTAAGSGFDPFATRTRLQAKASVGKFAYGTWDLGGLKLDATVAGGKAKADFSALNELVEGEGHLEATLGREIEARLTASLPMVNVQKAAGMADTLQLGADVDITARAQRDFSAYGAEGGFRHLRFLTPRKSIPAKDLLFAFATSRDTTTARVSAGDLYLNFGAAGTVDLLAGNFTKLADKLSRQIEKKVLDEKELRQALPDMTLHLDAGRDNPMSRILEHMGVSYNSARLRLYAGPEDGLNGDLSVGALRNGNLLLDTIGVFLSQDSTGFRLHGDIHNYTKRNPHKFRVNLDGYLQKDGVGAQLQFIDAQGRRGIDIGTRAALTDEEIRLSIYPQHPVIAYRNFTVNEDNFISLDKNKMLKANIDLLADDGTGLRVFSQPADSVNDITASISNLNLGELSDVLPYLPQLEGMLNGDFHLVDDHKNLSTSALFEASGLKFEGVDLGNIGMEAIYLPKEGGEHYANAYISANGTEVMECEGTYRDTEGGLFTGNISLHDFPLAMLNGFMAGTDMGLQGKAGGHLTVEGNLERPAINGALNFDSAHLYSDVYGFDFTMDRRPIEIKDNRMLFDNFGLYSRNADNPLVMNGKLDFADFSRITLDFNMKANDFELITAKRKKQSLVYGKVFANYNGTLRGTMDNLFIRGKLDVLDKTDMTYILKDSPLTVDDRLHDLVKFVSFEDSVAVDEETPVPVGGFDMTLAISINDAARFHCLLSEDGQNYVDLEGGGDMTMRITQQGDLRMTGRLTVNEGEMKYSLPVIPLKTFSITQGSYVDFTGDVTNPTLNIAATERMKATVTENDQPRTVAFDVGVAITKPLNDMGLEFTIEAPEDLSVQNQLATMTAAQRGKTAVAMLATGMYMTDDMMASGGSGFKASNALNAFLQSEIQSIAGSALKTIDVSIGMESGTSSAGTETTDYSFQFAKRFWNNRISVIIGGKVSTGEDAENSAASFIDNIALEYRLDKSASRYVRVFYDRGVQDPLEGQLTKTGAGLILRKKSNRLGELFLFRSKDKKNKDKEDKAKTKQ